MAPGEWREKFHIELEWVVPTGGHDCRSDTWPLSAQPGRPSGSWLKPSKRSSHSRGDGGGLAVDGDLAEGEHETSPWAKQPDGEEAPLQGSLAGVARLEYGLRGNLREADAGRREEVGVGGGARGADVDGKVFEAVCGGGGSGNVGA